MTATEYIAAFVSILTAVGALGVALSERNKRKADYSQQISAAAVILVDPLRERITDLEGDMELARKTICELERQLDTANEKIKQQSNEIAVVRKENHELKVEVARLSSENEEYCQRLSALGRLADRRSKN